MLEPIQRTARAGNERNSEQVVETDQSSAYKVEGNQS